MGVRGSQGCCTGHGEESPHSACPASCPAAAYLLVPEKGILVVHGWALRCVAWSEHQGLACMCGLRCAQGKGGVHGPNRRCAWRVGCYRAPSAGHHHEAITLRPQLLVAQSSGPPGRRWRGALLKKRGL